MQLIQLLRRHDGHTIHGQVKRNGNHMTLEILTAVKIRVEVLT